MNPALMVTRIVKSSVWQVIWHFLFRYFIVVGLPLLGWGLDDVAGFFSSPVRTAFVVVATAQALINAWLFHSKPLPPLPSERFEPYHAFFDIVEMIFFLTAFSTRRDIMTWNAGLLLSWLGLGIYLIGSSLSLWANFTWVNHIRCAGNRVYVDPVLLRAGPFHWVRYPGLLCLFFYGLGFSLIVQSWLGLALLIPMVSIIVRRVNILEKENAEEYPKDWPERCRTSKRIIPLMY